MVTDLLSERLKELRIQIMLLDKLICEHWRVITFVHHGYFILSFRNLDRQSQQFLLTTWLRLHTTVKLLGIGGSRCSLNSGSFKCGMCIELCLTLDLIIFWHTTRKILLLVELVLLGLHLLQHIANAWKMRPLLLNCVLSTILWIIVLRLT